MSDTSNYTSTIYLPNGVTLTAEISVPEEASYGAQLELGEVVQRAVSTMVAAYQSTTHPAPF